MKMYQLYVCEKCGKESRKQDDIDLCEAKHMGLNTLEEKHEYDILCSEMYRAARILSYTNCEETREQHDKAVVKVIIFEKEHNMTVWKGEKL